MQRHLPNIELKEQKLQSGSKSENLDSEPREEQKKRLHDFLFKMD